MSSDFTPQPQKRAHGIPSSASLDYIEDLTFKDVSVLLFNEECHFERRFHMGRSMLHCKYPESAQIENATLVHVSQLARKGGTL